ncbi:MAG: hypothetical protein AAB794_03095 [Patescibacteria group bacterium]
MRRLVIIKPGCKELANELLNYLSVYACGLATGATVSNPSFFERHPFFTLLKEETRATRLLSVLSKWTGSFLNRLWGRVYSLYASYMIRSHAACSLLALSEYHYLPPTRPPTEKTETCTTTYFFGWFFRNPVGLTRYRNELITAFAPVQKIQKTIEHIVSPLQKKHTLIGVHIKQKPYPWCDNGEFLVSPERTQHIVEEYIREKKLRRTDVALLVVSDNALSPSVFGDLKTHFSKEHEATNLFLLSKCSVVIGTNSTFSNLAAWFGNIPHIVVSNEPLDWEYYQDTATYFENKYATFAF